jgi:type IV pilus assembly protein PilN
MIRINLLPFRAARKKENIKRQTTIYGLSVVLLLMVMVYYFLRLNNEVSLLEKRQKNLRADFQSYQYQKTIKRIDELDKKIGEIKSKLAVIRKLEKKKTGPVHLLDEIAMAVPKDKLWLKSLNEKKGSLTLQGTAMDNETVALFMTNLEKAKHVNTVDLKSTKLRTVPKYKLGVSDFILDCKTYAYEEKPKEKVDAKKKKGSRRRRR